jgi:hypothetical protein
MSRNKFLTLLVLAFFVASQSACNLASVPGTAVPRDKESTASFETQVAGAVVATFSAQTAIAGSLAATQAEQAASTPEPTLTPTIMPTATLTATSSVPMVSVTIDTNCRSGPNTAFDLLGVLKVGENAEVVGRSPYTDSVVIKLPSNPNVTCWLWTQYATLVGNTSGLPIYRVPPTPTPRSSPTPLAAFNVIYSSTVTCSGTYVLKFKITNTGSVTWEANRIKVIDQTTKEEQTTIYDDFRNEINGCSLASVDKNLEAGEVGFSTSGGFSKKPAGHSFKASIMVCSANGMSGTCLEKTINFTP